MLAITAYGKGIPEDKQKFLFHISVDTTANGTQQEKGSGLGLLIAREFLAKSYGKLKVQSKEGKGATFRVYLPSSKN